MDEGKKEFIKKLRQNSNKYRETIIKKSSYRCEICEWSALRSRCLQVHHILPVEVYSNIFFFMKDSASYQIKFDGEMPNEEFETANQIALCPNCHMLVHTLIRSLDLWSMEEWLPEGIISDFINHACDEKNKRQFVYKFKQVATGEILKSRLIANRLKKDTPWKR